MWKKEDYYCQTGIPAVIAVKNIQDNGGRQGLSKELVANPKKYQDKHLQILRITRVNF